MSEGKNYKSIPFIDGDQISLGPINFDHINLYVRWMNAPKIRKYMRYNMPQTVEEVKKRFESDKNEIKSEIFIEVYHKQDARPIGLVGFIRIHWVTRTAHIFYLIGESAYWGQNIGTEAVKLVVSYGFNELNLHKITARTFGPNKASLRVIEKNNFHHEITLKKETYIDGDYVDLLNYIIFKDEWKKSQ
ncbi:MAG: GNAT family N-acetyltransferase [Promethearchaeota archaeon]